MSTVYQTKPECVQAHHYDGEGWRALVRWFGDRGVLVRSRSRRLAWPDLGLYWPITEPAWFVLRAGGACEIYDDDNFAARFERVEGAA
jgi:hypothetical protein